MYDSASMTKSPFFINFFSRNCFNQKSTLKIDSAAMWSTWNVLASLGLQWQHMIVRAFSVHCIAAEFVGSRETVPVPRIHLRPSIQIFPSICAEDDVLSKSRLLWQSIRLKGQTLKRAAIYLPSLSFFLVSWSASFDNVALEIIEVHRQCLENDTFVTSLYIEKCFKVSGI